MKISRFLLCVTVLFALQNTVDAQVVITPEDEKIAEELVSRMTLDEKIGMIGAERSFYLRGVERLGIPAIRIADGPQGVRNNTKSTLYPCGILTASTWNRELAYQMGAGLGRDAKARGVQIMLGPGVNIYRAPMCGRNYEYMGEDPYLASETAKEYILGVQDQGIMATVKHFAANNQLENIRHSVSSDVDERTMQEIYFPAFRKAVQEAGVALVMDSYNLIWGVHSTENPWLNNEVLRGQWGFKGIVISDWTSVYSTPGAVHGGLDLECPKGVYFTPEKLKPLIETGVIREKDIDEKVKHILQTYSAFGFLDKLPVDTTIALDNEESKATALELARQGIVLLENREGTLPLSRRAKVVVMGPNADVITTGGGSGFVTPYATVSPYEGLTEILGKKRVVLLSDDILYEDILTGVYVDESSAEQGFKAEYYNNKTLTGEVYRTETETDPTHYWSYGHPFDGMPDDGFSVRWTGVYKAPSSGTVRVKMAGDDGYRLYVNGELKGGDWGNHSLTTRSVFFEVEAGKTYDLRFEFYDNAGEATVVFEAGLMNKAKMEAALSEATDVLYCAGFNSSTEGEGWERSFRLPEDQLRMIRQISTMHDKVTVAVNAGGGVDFNGWSEDVEAVLMAWHPGQEGGRAIAEILTGKVSPSGKLPISIEDKWEDNPVHDSYYDKNRRVTYTEGVFMGYRGYDRTGKTPRYPFGYGLSYTDFEYSGLEINECEGGVYEVSFDIKNTGKTDGYETAQVYVGDVKSSVVRPLKELKGYEKVYVQAGKTVHVTVELDSEAFSFYDLDTKNFVVEPGDFVVSVGPSSAELPLTAVISVPDPEMEGMATVSFESDSVRVLDNPLNGWVMYLARNWDRNFWEKHGYDAMPADSGKLTVKVSDYASVAYLRTSWSSMEPEKGRYFWDDPDSRLSGLLESVRERGMKLAFRIVVDGRDQGPNTPDFVFEDGAKYYLQDPGQPDRKTPFPQDPVFRKHYEEFIEAFAREFNDPETTAFIDAYGLGKWGEGHNVAYEPGNAISDSTSFFKEDTMEWITGLYSRTFTKVPLVINYHRHIGAPVSEGRQVEPDSEHLLQIAIDNGYCLRADSFGMNNQDWGYNDWERSFVKKWAYKLPVIMEGGWIVGQHAWYNDPAGYKTPKDVRIGEFITSEEEKVNMMDFRAGKETASWFRDAFDYVQKFVAEGGYRLYPVEISAPLELRNGSDATIIHKWANMGWGYCPNNLKQWNYKYKVAFALLDDQGNVVAEFIDKDADPSKWIKGHDTGYDFKFTPENVPAGEYTLAAAIVDTSVDGCKPGIEVALPEDRLTHDGWVKVRRVSVTD